MFTSLMTAFIIVGVIEYHHLLFPRKTFNFQGFRNMEKK